MSQVSSLSVENSNGLAVRTGFNSLVAAVNSQHSGATAPVETVPYMMWADTSATPAALKMRNAANNGWLLLGTLDEVAGQFLPNGQLPGRNLVINGSGRINQRGYVSGAATSGANQFTLDRWFVQTSGQNLSFTGGSNRRIMTAPVGGVAQVIEGANIVGGTYVLNWDGTATASVNGTARAKGETFTLTDGANATVRFVGGTFTDVQLERGQVVTPFERNGIGQELSICQRYFVTLPSGAEYRGDCTSGVNYAVAVVLPTTMRAVPATTISVDLLNEFAVPTVTASRTTSLRIEATCNSTGAGRFFIANVSADAELTS